MNPPAFPKRYAVIGHPITHSRSPFIHDQFARQTHIRLIYEAIDALPNDFAAVVKGFFAAGGLGLNVTVPFKEQAYGLARDHLTPRARMAAAVNTLWIEQGQLHGCNTDGVGLINDLLRLGYPPQGRRILLVGAGGAAKGVVFPLLDQGCARLHIVNRTAQRATELCEHIIGQMPRAASQLSCGGLDQANDRWDMIINASSSSLGGDVPAIPLAAYADTALAYDMMYASAPTAFMQVAHQHGARCTADGLGMLVGQAAASFTLWHGVTPRMEPVLLTLRSLLATDGP